VQHALVAAIEPSCEREFIYDSYACRVGKGTHTGANRLSDFLRRAHRKWQATYILKADISQYFPSIDHKILLSMNKIFTSKLNLKNEATGTVEAVFALLNTPDSDRDVTLPNAFGRQSVILEPWAHNYSGLPVGKGKIFEQGEEAVFSGQFFMDNQSGREHYQALKALGELTQWSYSFQVIKSHPGIWTDGSKVQFLDRLDVFGVSPVVRGAQSSTYTRSIKGEKRTWMPVGRSDLTVKSARRTIETTLDELLGDELHDIEARVASHPEHPQ
jgi:hypothetical protein